MRKNKNSELRLLDGAIEEKKMGTNLYVVIPCYNEELVLPKSVPIILKKLEILRDSEMISDFKLVLVDDGSKDTSWQIIKKFCTSTSLCIGIKLSRNKGHQNALIAGMMYAKEKCDCVITMDADLQDDINAIDAFLKEYEKGNQIVYGVRADRRTDFVLKRNSAEWYYKILNILGIETIYNHADYRLISKKVLNELACYTETNLYLRGIIPQLGFKSTSVSYTRNKRIAGKTKYSLGKMVNLAFDGITSFSVKPLRIISVFGIVCSFFSLIGLVYAFASYFGGFAVEGWTAMISSIFLIGGIQLLAMGVIGEYIGKIFAEVKNRPRYIIEEIYGES